MGEAQLLSARNSREVPNISKQTAVKTKPIVDGKARAPALHLPDASSTAAIILSQAVEYCAQKMGLTTQATIDRVKQGDGMACGYCHYSAAQHVADMLGMLDSNVQTAYMFEYDATPEDVSLTETARIIPMHLLVWVKQDRHPERPGRKHGSGYGPELGEHAGHEPGCPCSICADSRRQRYPNPHRVRRAALFALPAADQGVE